jgi:glycosyltransferase involved in cell wall biosynthesis
MKILHVDTGREWRGGQRQVFFLHQGLTSRGIESLVVAHPKGSLYHRLADPKISLPCKGEWDLPAAFRLARILKRVAPDIAHAHDAHAHTLLLLALSLLSASSLLPASSLFMASSFKKKPHLVISRRVDFHLGRSLWSKWKYQTPRIGKIITVSQGIKDVLLQDGLAENKICVVHSGVMIRERPRPTDAGTAHAGTAPDAGIARGAGTARGAQIRQQLSIPAGARVLGCIANFADHKDHRTLLRVFQALAEKEENVYLLLVGDGPLYAAIRAESRRIPYADRIIFTGYQEDVYPYLMSFDVFVLTSYLEGLCTSLIDSLVCAVPIVASRTGGIPEVVQDGKNGFLVEVRDISGFVTAILRLLKDPPLYQAFQENCLISAQHFSIENMVNGTLEVYRQFVTENGHPSL